MKNGWLCGVALAALVVAGSAQAADLKGAPVYKASPIAAYNWTGFYLGVNTGVGASQIRTTFPDVAGVFIDRGGSVFAGGAQAGFNWQFAPQWVAGIEGDVSFLGINRSLRDLSGFADGFGVKTDGYGTIRGRLGYTTGPSLFYVTGGVAFVNIKNSFDSFRSPLTLASESKTASGWIVGGGMETLLGGNWSAKAEYLYIDAGSQDVFNPFFDSISHFDNRFSVYRYGLNYKFGGPAVAAALPVYNWTGFYAGVNVGAGLSQDHVTGQFIVPPPIISAVDIADRGFTGGMQAGYNWQFSPNWVAGLEGDIGGLGINRSLIDFSLTVGVKTDWYGTLRGRLGYSTGPALLYVTGGAAFVNIKNSLDQNLVHVVASKSESATGWTVGGGIETVLAQNWTAKTEYLYIDAGGQDVVNPFFAGVNRTAHFDNRFHVFRMGLNYKFN